VVTTEDRSEVLSIRVDRRQMAGRPSETSHLEFPKEHCIACIGEDLPVDLLRSCGIERVTGGPNNKKRMVVSRILESSQPNVYLAGDILSQAYFETDDFEGDPTEFREVRHRGNIKSALKDGVLIAEVVRQRLDGKEQIEVPEVTEPDALRPPAPATEESEAFLVHVLPTGVEAEEFPLARHSVTTIGRHGCDVTLPDATQLADRHASILRTDGGYLLRDDGSATGVFLRLRPALGRRLEHGDLLLVGRQFLRVSCRDSEFFVTHFDSTGTEVGRHPLGEKAVILGRQAPDVTLDAGDRTLSRRQLALKVRQGAVLAKDLKSVNGSFLRVRGALPLAPGDQFRLGQQLFVLTLGAESVIEADVAGAPAESPAEPGGATPSAATARFNGAEEPVPVEPGQTLCDVAERYGIEITADCHSGICGSDPIRILSGRENLDAEPGDQERDTLEDLCELEPGDCRLACMVRLKGPVEVETL
jgi:pSer/pThr/pTyr-binding forkhead associated (FHA) protein/ferredoxin